MSPRLSICALTIALAACAAPTRQPVTAAPSPLAPTPTVAAIAPAEPAAEPAIRAVTIGASGDLLFHLKVVRTAREHADEGGFAWVLGGLESVIGEDELAFANLETPLSERVPPETGDPPILGAPAEAAAALSAVGIDVVSVANNHGYDQTAIGMSETLAALDEAGVRHVGAAIAEVDAPGPAIFERDGVRVAFVAFTERLNRGPVFRGDHPQIARYDAERAEAALRRARELADVVVLSIHWSSDFITEPRRGQRRRARALVDAGADVIIGHGPHVLQEVERLESARGDALVAYSLGNLVSNQALRYWVGRRRPPEGMHPAVILPALRDGAWLRTRLVVEDDTLRIERVEAVPLWTRNNFVQFANGHAERLEIRVDPLHISPERVRAERLPMIAEALGDAVTLIGE